MLHIWLGMRGVLPTCTDSHLHPVDKTIYSHQFYETDTRRNFTRGYTLFASGTGGPLSTALRVKAPWGTQHHRTMRHYFPHILSISAIGEDLADDGNRVELDPSLKDSNGLPAPRVIYSLSENCRRMMDHAAERGRELLESAGAVDVTLEGIWPGTSHFMGTARLGKSPTNSVVNEWHQAHDVPNLFLVDGSSFVTAGAVGPTPTIAALALRCADGIWERRKEWQ